MPLKLKTDALLGFVLIHLIAALAFVPWFFSWTGVVLLVAGIYVFGVLGISVGYHRLLTHRAFVSPRWLERVFAVIGTCCMQFSPAFWVAVHRRHHHFADEEKDPHSPIKSFLWAHFGWLLVRPPDMKPAVMTDRYARDILRDPFYAWLERHKNWIKVAIACWVAYFAAGFLSALAMGEDVATAFQFGASLFIWGGVLRTVVVWHTTWSVNSVTHMWGYRNYSTPDDSRNNWIVGLLTGGEGWHNNHHADPSSARFGHRWWEFDPGWLTIRAMQRLGLASKVSLPSASLKAR